MPSFVPPHLRKAVSTNAGSAAGSNSGGSSASHGSYGYNSGSNNGLPSKIKCYKCKKHKASNGYSNKQREAAQSSIRAGRPILASCIECNQQTVVEITCIECKETKAVSDYAKAQAKKPDEARCFKCVEKRTELEVQKNDSDSDEPPDAYDEDDYDSDTQTILLAQSTRPSLSSYAASSSETGGVSLSGFSGMSISSRDNTDNEEALYKTKSYRSQGTTINGFKVATSRAWGPGSAAASRTAGSVATSSTMRSPPGLNERFNPRAYGHPSSTAPSVAESNVGSMNTERNSTCTTTTAAKHRNFAKVKAYVKPKKDDDDFPVHDDSSDEGSDYSDP